MGRYDSRALNLALGILRATATDGVGHLLTPAEKLACRVLLPVVGKEPLVRLANHIEKGNPMYRRRMIEQSLAVIEEAVLRVGWVRLE
jgi:hypothetical protein